MHQDFKIGNRVITIVSPLNDETGERAPTPYGSQGTIISFIKNENETILSALILFDEPMPHRHTEATDFGVSYKKAQNQCWWVSIKMLCLTTPFTEEEKQAQKEQNIIKKCKFLDQKFKDYQKTKKDYKYFCSFSQYIKGNY